mmetsp:Transcript_11047/g.23688  ORF Transcript_11047/g.23688 Transcript_11047/m.23688 type:complete len:282 (-) Transcript_11047:61-906(-)
MYSFTQKVPLRLKSCETFPYFFFPYVFGLPSRQSIHHLSKHGESILNLKYTFSLGRQLGVNATNFSISCSHRLSRGQSPRTFTFTCLYTLSPHRLNAISLILYSPSVLKRCLNVSFRSSPVCLVPSPHRTSDFVNPSDSISNAICARSPALISFSSSFRYLILCTQQPGVSTVTTLRFRITSPHSFSAFNMILYFPIAVYLCVSDSSIDDPTTSVDPSPKSTVHFVNLSDEILSNSLTLSPTAITRSSTTIDLILCRSQPAGQSPTTWIVLVTDLLFPRQS